MVNSKLLAEIYRITDLLPPSILSQVVKILAENDEFYNEALTKRVLNSLVNLQFRRAVVDMFNVWKNEQPESTSRAVAMALESASYTRNSIQKDLAIELVWTGPEFANVTIRRTEQVLLQLIEECHQHMTLISFAFYKIPEITKALLKALERGIHLRIIAETPASGDNKIKFGIESTLGSDVLNQSEVFIWPKERRLLDREGRYGSLHIKGAIVDQKKLFITSANLTDYALSLNMELGVLIQSEKLSKQMIDYIDLLIYQGILVIWTE
ncbi:DISARM system phospholipase D-like protein DrmC [Synechococcus sp. C9]|uniref:DISARM system phospholipase D-like protein DrmC n=1 Tax=Synechococcus sp. C9 TaxID=102119 RepID=UPI001FF4A2E7|nr:DISARM system phospholipase D-like protein DrmC [Synechococcus sp. C9]